MDFKHLKQSGPLAQPATPEAVAAREKLRAEMDSAAVVAVLRDGESLRARRRRLAASERRDG